MSRREPGPCQAVHRTIVVVDVSGYGDARRTSEHRLVVRQALYQALRQAFGDSSVPWKDCLPIDCGDGVPVLVPPDIPRLQHHNSRHPTEEQLRLALHAGEVVHDEFGVTAPSIDHAFRLLEAAQVKAALRSAPGPLAVITSAWFHDEVVRRTPPIDATAFRPIEVAVKETDAIGRPALPESPATVGEPPPLRGIGPRVASATRREAPSSACRAKSRPNGPGSYMDDHSGRHRYHVLPAQSHGRCPRSIPGLVSQTSLGRRNQRPRKEIFRPPVGFCAVLVIPCAVSAEMGRD